MLIKSTFQRPLNAKLTEQIDGAELTISCISHLISDLLVKGQVCPTSSDNL